MNVGMYELEIEEVKTVIKKVWICGDRNSWILLGAPGVGKTIGTQELCAELAASENLEFIVYSDDMFDEIMKNRDKYWVHVEFAASISEPSDFMGIPREENDYVKYKPLAWAIALTRGKGSLFLDEITNVKRPDTRSAMLKVLLEKTVGFTRLSKDVLIIGAGNRQEQSSLAEPLDAPFLGGRVVLVNVRQPCVERWIEYMDRVHGNEWDRRVALFLKRFPEYFLKQNVCEGYESFPTPRGWTKAALLSNKLDKGAREVFTYGLVGREVAPLFCSFLETSVPPIEQLCKRPSGWLTLREEEKFFVALEIANMNVNDIGKVIGLLEFISENDREFLSLIIALKRIDERKLFILELKKKSQKVYEQIIKAVVLVSKIRSGVHEWLAE